MMTDLQLVKGWCLINNIDFNLSRYSNRNTILQDRWNIELSDNETGLRYMIRGCFLDYVFDLEEAVILIISTSLQKRIWDLVNPYGVHIKQLTFPSTKEELEILIDMKGVPV